MIGFKSLPIYLSNSNTHIHNSIWSQLMFEEGSRKPPLNLCQPHLGHPSKICNRIALIKSEEQRKRSRLEIRKIINIFLALNLKMSIMLKT